MKPIIAGILLFVSTILPAFCWSAPGHEAIAIAAMQMIKGTPADTKVNAILDGDAPADAAIWLDLVREHHQFLDESQNDEANLFRQSFPQSSDWHFCNFIVGSTAYDFSSKYASNDDVVHALEHAVEVLEGAASDMSKQQALRAVFHLVGDIHQPLHCITGFYDLSNMSHPVLLTDVENPQTAIQDRGGNQLYYTKSQEFHALWDLGLPKTISPDVNTLADDLVSGSLDSKPVTPGDYHHWAEAWAGESMKAANAAYSGIVYNSAGYVPDPRHHGKQMLKIYITLPDNYKADQHQRVQDQLSTAAVRLAQLLQKIKFN